MRHRGPEPDPWTERLSEYVDGDLSTRQCRALEDHLRGCAECAGVVAELRRLVAEAPALNVDSVPSRDLWPGVEKRLTRREEAQGNLWLAFRGGRLVPRLATAGALLVLLLVAGLWLGHRPAGDGKSTNRDSAVAVGIHRTASDQEYDRVVAALEREARVRLTHDPRVVEVLEDNLATLDVAIANYREALTDTPGDAHLATRLAATRERKLEVLRQAVTLAAEGTN